MVAGSWRSRRIAPHDTDSCYVAAGFVTPAYADKATFWFRGLVSGFVVLLTPFTGFYIHKLVAEHFPETLIGWERLVYNTFGGTLYNSTGIFTIYGYFTWAAAAHWGSTSGAARTNGVSSPWAFADHSTHCPSPQHRVEASSEPTSSTAD